MPCEICSSSLRVLACSVKRHCIKTGLGWVPEIPRLPPADPQHPQHIHLVCGAVSKIPSPARLSVPLAKGFVPYVIKSQIKRLNPKTVFYKFHKHSASVFILLSLK